MQYGGQNISPVEQFLRNKWVRIVLAIDVILLVVAIFTAVNTSVKQTTKVSTIDFNIAPVDAIISVNGDTKYENGQYMIAPGTYEIKISRDGLETKILSVNIEPDHIVNVTTFLVGVDGDLSFYELKDNSQSYEKLKTIVSEGDIDEDTTAVKELISKIDKMMTIFDKLPIKGYVYADPSINTSTGGFAIKNGQSKDECEKIACLLVSYFGEGYEDLVIKKIKEAGYNPEDYQLIYERYRSSINDWKK